MHSALHTQSRKRTLSQKHTQNIINTRARNFAYLRIRRQIDLGKVDGANRLAIVDVRNQFGGHVDSDGRLRLLGGAACEQRKRVD